MAVADSESPAPTNGNQTGVIVMSKPDQLTELIAKATSLYSIKNYAAAAEIYSEATELQAEVNGEMNIENADLLYAYGRCLFYVAQKTSTVLGGTAAQAQLAQDGGQKVSKKRKANGLPKVEETEGVHGHASSGVVETLAPADVAPTSAIEPGHTAKSSDKPMFQFEGDENFADSSDEEEEEQEGEGAEEEEEDDFANSFELLDLARILFLKKLDAAQESKAADADKGKYVASIDLTPEVRQIKVRIADIYDLQSEISLEGEKFPAAVTDLKSCLALKEELEPPESSLLAECHYKLSLALEAAGQEQQRDSEGNPVGDITINWDLRNEAIVQQEKAIDSCKLRVSKETKAAEPLPEGKDKDKALAQIEDVQDMISAMEDRLSDLRKPPISVKAETENDAKREMMTGILGQIMGGSGSTKSKEEQQAELAKVMASAQDLSSMVKRKKVKPAPTGTATGPATGDDTASNASGTSTSTKRKAGEVDGDDPTGPGGKKVRVDEIEDSGN